MFNKHLIVAGLCVCSAGAYAAEGDQLVPENGVYFGGALGRANVKLDVDDFGEVLNTHELGWKIFAGYRFTKNLSLEASYADLGEHDVSSGGGAFVRLEPEYISGSVIGTWPLKANFAVFGRVGYANWKTRQTISDGTLTGSIKEDGNEITWGAGLSTMLDGAIVRLEYERVENVDSSTFATNDTHAELEMISLGVAWNF